MKSTRGFLVAGLVAAGIFSGADFVGQSLVSVASAQDRDRDRDDDRRRGDDDDDDRRREEMRRRYEEYRARSNPPPTTGPTFGVLDSSQKVPGFEVPLSVDAHVPLEKRYSAKVIEYVREEFIEEKDRNRNGMLERNEWTGRWSPSPDESDINKDGILTVEELCIRMTKRFGSSSQSNSSSRSSSSSGSSSSNAPSDAARFRGFAEGMMRRFDGNQNGRLEKDEWSKLPSEHQAYDTNKDTIITVDELAAGMQARYGSGRSRDGSSSSSSTASSKQPPMKKSYRFASPTERLPKGMPDWFLRGDANGDGQVSMAEYATSWTEQVAAEFLKYDLDNDGVITPEECLGPDAKTASSSRSSSSGSSSYASRSSSSSSGSSTSGNQTSGSGAPAPYYGRGSYGPPGGSGGERPSFGDRSSYGDRPSFGDRSSGERPSYGYRSYGDRSYGDRSSGERTSEGQSSGDRSDGDRPSFGGRPPFGRGPSSDGRRDDD